MRAGRVPLVRAVPLQGLAHFDSISAGAWAGQNRRAFVTHAWPVTCVCALAGTARAFEDHQKAGCVLRRGSGVPPIPALLAARRSRIRNPDIAGLARESGPAGSLMFASLFRTRRLGISSPGRLFFSAHSSVPAEVRL